jgi:polyketide cyclase/dehydrase/lipid transport protein
LKTVSAIAEVALDRDEALALWTDLRRWPSFVEGFARTLEVGEDWPGDGSKVVWESTPDGRGRVTEKVVANVAPGEGPARFETEVYEERLLGLQTVEFAPASDGARVQLRLEYELAGAGGPFRGLTDVLFIRRALRDALRRTLGRFAVEAEEEAGLR